jgi:uncharacterized repeat protein (TIGR03803 family)
MNAKPDTRNCLSLGSDIKSLLRAFSVLAVGALLGLGASAWAEVPEQILKSFGNAPQSGSRPAGVLVGADGALYGTTSAGGIYNNGTVFRVNVDGSRYTVLHAFGANTNDGVTPLAGLVQGRDGMLYGTTSGGGAKNLGTVFKVDTDGSGYKALHSFTDYTKDGKGPTALIQGADGALYGVAREGGTFGYGTAFRLSTNGVDYATLYFFGSYSGDGTVPVALTQGTDGGLYGVTKSGVIMHPPGGAVAFDGTVFRLATNGSTYAILHSFGSFTGDGAAPTGLTQGSSGVLYGVTQGGGSNAKGVVFMLNTNGSGYTLAHQFSDTLGDGAGPCAGLLRGADGCWYGTTLGGGAINGYGTVFRMNADCSGYRVIRRFSAVNSAVSNFSTDGQQPGALAQGPNGLLYGTTAYGGMAHPNGAGTLFALGTNATDYGVIYYFSNSGDEGQAPVAGLTLGRDGSFYGVTPSGGLSSQGLIFNINADGGGYNTLHEFGLDPIDGTDPQGGLMQGVDGMFYGTTLQGGFGLRRGTVFKVNPDGSHYTVVLNFGFATAEWDMSPASPPVQGRDGRLYGSSDGGNWDDWGNTYGMVYTVDTNGLNFATLYQFSTNGLEGWAPLSGLIQGRDGTLYGASYRGGANGVGTVFNLGTDGNGFQVLHMFANDGVDGGNPTASLMLGADGLLYGTTQMGGSKSGGTIFKMDTNGSSYQVIHNFGSVTNDGQSPAAGLIQGRDGYLYGTTTKGGAYPPGNRGYDGYGVAFKVETTGSGYTVLYSFGGTANDGRNPQGGLTQGLDGAFYGTTSAGGILNAGTVFRLGSAPFGFTAFKPLPDKTFALSLSGSSNTTCRIDASTNLVNWVTLTNLPNTTGGVQFIDLSATHFPRRFYRAVQGQ